MMMGPEDPEDILSTSLQTLYNLTPIAHSSPGSLFTYTSPSRQHTLTLRTPEPHHANWSLHASSIWVASLYLADHLDGLGLDTASTSHPLHVLELGAGAGLPSILIAKSYPHVLVTASDYPDDDLIHTLADNIARNHAPRCRAVAYAWGADPSILNGTGTGDGTPNHAFDVVFAADTLWNPDSHPALIQTLQHTLKKSTAARAHLVAGLHTGRYTLQAFLNAVGPAGFELAGLSEREVRGDAERPWDVATAESEDEQERRRWVVWIALRWTTTRLV